ncbi:MAG: hypothetical protein MZV64_43370 [Ignavibacteriales bacterium]|nr:hypothetical protein [Ignavibacteriales bacterium]
MSRPSPKYHPGLGADASGRCGASRQGLLHPLASRLPPLACRDTPSRPPPQRSVFPVREVTPCPSARAWPGSRSPLLFPLLLGAQAPPNARRHRPRRRGQARRRDARHLQPHHPRLGEGDGGRRSTRAA